MSIYASAVVLWFMAITGASIRGWFRSPRPHEYAVIETGSIARRRMRMTRSAAYCG
jgi:hypothetical protein